jgi:hypothetical protein
MQLCIVFFSFILFIQFEKLTRIGFFFVMFFISNLWFNIVFFSFFVVLYFYHIIKLIKI